MLCSETRIHVFEMGTSIPNKPNGTCLSENAEDEISLAPTEELGTSGSSEQLHFDQRG